MLNGKKKMTSNENNPHDYESFMRWAHSMCQTIDTFEKLVFEKDSIEERFQERCVYAAKAFRDATKENDYVINLQKSSPDFKRGFIFSMRAVIDMVENKPNTYTIADLMDFLHNFILVNHTMENIEKMKNEI